MKNLNLDCVVRVKLQGILGAARGSLGRLVALQEIYRQVRFSEDERAQMTETVQGNGMSFWQWPEAPGWGAKTVHIEDAHATVLLDELDQFQGFQIADLDWVESLKKQLRVGKAEQR